MEVFLPDELWLIVLASLDHVGLCSLASVSRRCRRLASSQHLWKALCASLSPQTGSADCDAERLVAASTCDYRALYVRLSTKLRRERAQAHARRLLRCRSAVSSNASECRRLCSELLSVAEALRAPTAAPAAVQLSPGRLLSMGWLPRAVRDTAQTRRGPWEGVHRLQEQRELRLHAQTTATTLFARRKEGEALAAALAELEGSCPSSTAASAPTS